MYTTYFTGHCQKNRQMKRYHEFQNTDKISVNLRVGVLVNKMREITLDKLSLDPFVEEALEVSEENLQIFPFCTDASMRLFPLEKERQTLRRTVPTRRSAIDWPPRAPPGPASRHPPGGAAPHLITPSHGCLV